MAASGLTQFNPQPDPAKWSQGPDQPRLWLLFGQGEAKPGNQRGPHDDHLLQHKVRACADARPGTKGKKARQSRSGPAGQNGRGRNDRPDPYHKAAARRRVPDNPARRYPADLMTDPSASGWCLSGKSRPGRSETPDPPPVRTPASRPEPRPDRRAGVFDPDVRPNKAQASRGSNL